MSIYNLFLLRIVDKDINKILQQFKNDKITLDTARLTILVLTGVRKSLYCKLDRLSKDCSIAENTSSGCDKSCGQYIGAKM